MADLLRRTTPTTLTFRSEDTDGRTIFGRAVPYGDTIDVRDASGSYRERFEPGAFARSIKERGHKVKLMVQHDARRLPIGRAVELVEREDGLYGAFAVASTRDGDEALELVRAGIVDSFSIGFAPVRDIKRDGVVVRAEAALREVSLVSFPAYEGAEIVGIRSVPILTTEAARRRLVVATARF